MRRRKRTESCNPASVDLTTNRPDDGRARCSTGKTRVLASMIQSTSRQSVWPSRTPDEQVSSCGNVQLPDPATTIRSCGGTTSPAWRWRVRRSPCGPIGAGVGPAAPVLDFEGPGHTLRLSGAQRWPRPVRLPRSGADASDRPASARTREPAKGCEGRCLPPRLVATGRDVAREDTRYRRSGHIRSDGSRPNLLNGAEAGQSRL